jgi:hypothetical protein
MFSGMDLRMQRNERAVSHEGARELISPSAANSVNGDHRNARFVGGTDKRCSRVLSRNFPVNCIPARPNRYEIFFSIVDRPANRQHFGSLEKGCDKFVFFRPAYNEH